MSAQAVKLIPVASNTGIHGISIWRPRFKRMLIVALVLIAVALCLPTHYYVRTQAVAIPKNSQWVSVVTAGRVIEVLVRAGDRVKKGQPLLILENKELSMQHESALAQCDLAQLYLKQAQQSNDADRQISIPVLQSFYEACLASQQRLQQQLDDLIVRAPSDGVVVSQVNLDRLQGIYLKTRNPLLQVCSLDAFELLIPLTEGEALVVAPRAPVRGRLVGSGQVFNTCLEDSAFRKAHQDEYLRGFDVRVGGPAPQQQLAPRYPSEKSAYNDPEERLYPIFIAQAPVDAKISAQLAPQMRVRVEVVGERMLIGQKVIRIIKGTFR